MIPQILLPRYFKWIGLVTYLCTMKYAFYYAQFHDLDDVNFSMGLYIQLGVTISLVMMIYSKLKYEDEMTKHIRLVSLQWAIIIYMLIRIGYKSMAFYFRSSDLLPSHQVNFLLLLYLLLFYSQVYFLPWIKSKFTKNEE
jgi:hypothetical protein